MYLPCHNTHPLQCRAHIRLRLQSVCLVELGSWGSIPLSQHCRMSVESQRWEYTGVLIPRAVQIQTVAHFSGWLLAIASWRFTGRWYDILFQNKATVQTPDYLSNWAPSLWRLWNFLVSKLPVSVLIVCWDLSFTLTPCRAGRLAFPPLWSWHSRCQGILFFLPYSCPQVSESHKVPLSFTDFQLFLWSFTSEYSPTPVTVVLLCEGGDKCWAYLFSHLKSFWSFLS